MTSLLDLGFTEQKEGVKFTPIPNGIYDAYVHCIIGLGLQPQQPDYTTKEPRDPAKEIRVVFEIPSIVREDEQTSVIKLDMRTSVHEKSMYAGLFRAVFGLSTDSMDILNTSADALLGKVLSLRVREWSNEKTGRSGNGIKKDDMQVLDPRLAAVAKPATRPTFIFNPYNPDMEVFNTMLTYWTKKDIMEALDSSQFPAVMHEAWVKVQEESKNKQQTETAPFATGTSTEAIE